MEPEKGTGRGRESESEPASEHFLSVSASLLGLRHFTSCRDFAREVPRSDPKISDSVDRILAIADVLLAAERRLKNNHFDWYAILQLRRGDSGNRQLMRSQFKRLAYLLNPNRNGFAFSNDAFMLVRDAWLVLSDPGKRAQYEQAIDNPPPKGVCKQRRDKQKSSRDVRRNAHNVNVGEPKASFWTVCPYCWVLYEYEKIYEECSLRCQNCRRVFHGVAVKPPATEMVVMGKEQYYCYCAHAPVRYPVSQHSKTCGMGEQKRVFYAEEAGTEGVHGELGKNVGEGIQGNVNGKRRMRVKTVARNTKKITGNRRSRGHISPDRDAELSDMDVEDGELEFTEGKEDIFVNVRYTK